MRACRAGLRIGRRAAVVAALTGVLVVMAAPALALVAVDHRGEHMYHQEDTVSSTDAAYALNGPGSATELDVWHAANNQNVANASEAGTDIIMHDRTLGRTTNCTGYVDTYSVGWLTRNCRVDFWKNLPTQPIPTLAEEFAAVAANPGQWVHMDIRGSWDANQIVGLRDALKRYGILNRASVMTAGDPMLLKFKRNAPDIWTVWRKHCDTAGCYTISPADAQYYHVKAVMIWSTAYYSQAYVDSMHNIGVQVWNSTCDAWARACWNTLKSWGVDRVMTNNPTKFGSGAW